MKRLSGLFKSPFCQQISPVLGTYSQCSCRASQLQPYMYESVCELPNIFLNCANKFLVQGQRTPSRIDQSWLELLVCLKLIGSNKLLIICQMNFVDNQHSRMRTAAAQASLSHCVRFCMQELHCRLNPCGTPQVSAGLLAGSYKFFEVFSNVQSSIRAAECNDVACRAR